MAKKQSKTPPTAQNTEEEYAFLIGEAVMVTAGTYRGEKATVVAYCKNGSTDSYYVQCEKSGEKCLKKGSLSKLSGTKSVSKSMGGDSVPTKVNSPKEAHEDLSGISANTTSTNSYGRRVLDLYEYVSNLKDKTDDMDLKYKLREVEKMIIGLSLND